MVWVGGFRGWRGSVGRQWRDRRCLVWFDDVLGLMVGFVPLGLVSSLSLDQAQMVGLMVV